MNTTVNPDKLNLTFDYEINTFKHDSNNHLSYKINILDSSQSQHLLINFNSFKDTLLSNSSNLQLHHQSTFTPANCLKRLVSKQKRRYQDNNFDLDMTYITSRVIAMGYPSTGCETLYRNSLSDVQRFFQTHHKNNVKIYNLCIENERIYSKHIFNNKCKVGFFPSADHNPCPIKLILEFCVDICLYLITNPKSVAAVHCKAGKGRTGVMICSYLIFSNLCSSSENALKYYAGMRTKNNTGVTIPSQRRYVQYFHSFLRANFASPFMLLIPKIIEQHFTHLYNKQYKKYICNNILHAFNRSNGSECYFVLPNIFKVTCIEIGPLPKGKHVFMKVCNFNKSNNDNGWVELQREERYGEVWYVCKGKVNTVVNSDIKVCVSGSVNFYMWVNLWYATLEMLEKRIDNDETESEDDVSADVWNWSRSGSSRKMEEKEKKAISLYEVVLKLGGNMNLNTIVDEVNLGLVRKVDKTALKISLGAEQFDKFEEKKKIRNVKLNIYYKLLE